VVAAARPTAAQLLVAHARPPTPLSTTHPQGASVLFWFHDRAAGQLLPVILKVPPNMPVPLATIVSAGPPPHSVPPPPPPPPARPAPRHAECAQSRDPPSRPYRCRQALSCPTSLSPSCGARTPGVTIRPYPCPAASPSLPSPPLLPLSLWDAPDEVDAGAELLGPGILCEHRRRSPGPAQPQHHPPHRRPQGSRAHEPRTSSQARRVPPTHICTRRNVH